MNLDSLKDFISGSSRCSMHHPGFRLAETRVHEKAFSS